MLVNDSSRMINRFVIVINTLDASNAGQVSIVFGNTDRYSCLKALSMLPLIVLYSGFQGRWKL